VTSPWGTPQEPQQGDRFREADAWNRRLLLRPTEYIPDMKKLDSRGDALKLNVVDLDNEGGPRLYTGILWFSGPLIGILKGSIGTPFIGYITKEKNSNGYMAWKFYDLQTDPETDARAQAYLREHPEFLAPLQPAQSFGGPQPFNPTAHHEQGPAPAWAGPVEPRFVPGAQGPAGPPAPPAPPRAPQAPPGGFGGPPAPPAPPVSGPPGGDPADVMARLRRAAGIPDGSGANVGSGEEPPF
jgi:hypothetical protein